VGGADIAGLNVPRLLPDSRGAVRGGTATNGLNLSCRPHD
jgi:hypothetical protein